jgi:hypothetical protein
MVRSAPPEDTLTGRTFFGEIKVDLLNQEPDNFLRQPRILASILAQVPGQAGRYRGILYEISNLKSTPQVYKPLTQLKKTLTSHLSQTSQYPNQRALQSKTKPTREPISHHACLTCRPSPRHRCCSSNPCLRSRPHRSRGNHTSLGSQSHYL